MSIKPDYEALFRASPYPYLVMDNNLTIIGANDAYLRSVDRTEAEIVGLYAFEAFPENPDDPDSTNMREIKASLETAIATGRPHATSCLRYALPKKSSDSGGFEERYWSLVHTPAIADDGSIAFVFQNAIDVTHLYKFDKTSKAAPMELRPDASEDTEKFGRAQIHEAMTRIINDERGHLRHLFNQAPGFVAVLTGPQYVFEIVNEAYYQLVGHREIIGKPVWEALPEVAGQGYEEILETVRKSGKPWAGRGIGLKVQQAPGAPLRERYVDLIFQPYRTEDGTSLGIFLQGHDVTEAFEAQAARQESEERLKEGMLAAKMVVWEWNEASGEVFFSDNVSEVLGRASDASDNLYEAIHPDDREKALSAHRRAIAEHCSYREVLRFMRPDNGKMIWIDVQGKFRRDAQGKNVMRGVTVDITERMEAEEELRNADRRKDEFLAMLAHELRNPLAPISSAAQLMKLVKVDEERLKQTSDIILRQIAHMTGLVDDLIDVSRVTRGLITTDKVKLDVKRIISDAVEQTAPAMESKGHRLQVELAPEGAFVLGDQKRLVQVLANILNNAAKYTPHGGKIVLHMETEAEYVSITVTDNGIGMSDELLPRVFDLFAQAERTSDRSQGGLGVGLALVKSLVELHGGKVLAASNGHGMGSKFTVCLPRLQDLSEHRWHDAAGADQQAVPNPRRIMVVDDNVDAAATLAMFLEASGHQVMIEHSASAALQRALAKVPDIFLLDIGLPEMDGNELARRLRAHPQTAKAVLIAITGYGQEQDREKTRASGFNYHLVKPVDATKLLALLENFVT